MGGEPCRHEERPDDRPDRPDELIPEPHELVPPNRTPDTIAGWKAVADGLLSDPCCAFHRNVEISSRYAWIYTLQPACFKWAAMAAIASHHIRLALFPLRLDADRSGYVDIPHSLRRPKLLLTEDVNTIRATNNAIFNDLFWVHFAYVAAEDGIERRVHPRTGHGELRHRGDGTGHGSKGEQVADRPAATRDRT